MEVKKAPVEIKARVMETLDAFIAPKKVSQCNAMTTPAAMRISKVLGGNFNFFFFHNIQVKIRILAKDILYQTSGTASIVMSAPNTAVNPQIKTIT